MKPTHLKNGRNLMRLDTQTEPQDQLVEIKKRLNEGLQQVKTGDLAEGRGKDVIRGLLRMLVIGPAELMSTGTLRGINIRIG